MHLLYNIIQRTNCKILRDLYHSRKEKQNYKTLPTFADRDIVTL